MTDLVMGEPDEDPTRLIYIVRHGETALNAEHLMRGWDNPPLNPQGIKDAEAVKEILADCKIDSCYCSDLKRAVQTMQTIVKGHTMTPVVTGLLRTIDVGIWTGKPVTEVEPKLAELQIRWETRPELECPGGESWKSFQDRQLQAWRKILAGKGDTLIVGHLRTSVWAMGYVLTGGKALAGSDLTVLNRITQSPGVVTVLSYSRGEGLKITGMNQSEV